MDNSVNELPSGEIDDIRSKIAEEEDISKEKGAENSVPNKGNVDNTIVDNTEDNQRDSGSLVSEDHEVRRCTRTGVLVNLEGARKKTRKAGMAVKTSIRRLDNMLREQCTDIVKLTASNGRLNMDMEDFKRFHEEVMDLLLLSSNDDQYGDEDQRFYDAICENFLESDADVKTRINDLTQERQEMFSQRSRYSGKSRVSRVSRVSFTSSKQAAANAAALKEKMLSLKRKQDIERQQEELKQHQRELEWKKEQEQLQGEINAAEVLHQTLVADTTIPCNTQPTTNPVRANTQANQPDDNMNTIAVVPGTDTIPSCVNIQSTPNIVHATSSQPITNDNMNPGVPIETTNNPIQPNLLDPCVPPFTPVSSPTQPVEQPQPNTLQEKIQRDTIEIQRQQVELMKRMTLPTPKPPVFNGDILAYPKWVLAFDALIDSEAVNPGHKLYYLGQYTSGKAQKTINGLLGLQSEDAYKRARKILQERFGDPFRIYEAYNEKLKSWPVCSKGHELQEFSDFLVMVQETMKTVKYLEDFNTFSAIQDLVARLPPYYSKKWLQSAKGIEHVKGKYDFNNLVDFVQGAAKDATHPVFSYEALLSKRREILKVTKQEERKPELPRRRPGTTFNTSKFNEQPPDDSKVKNRELTCPACNKPHKLESCEVFLKKSVKERSEFAKSKGMCFLCLRHGHVARQCKESFRCQTCKKPHATILHFEFKTSKISESMKENKPEKNSEGPKEEKPRVANRVVVCHSNECKDTTTSCLILPVKICHKDNPNKKIMTYAVLDDQSDTCFVTDSICDELEIAGPETVIELGTMHAVENIKTQKISGLIVSPEDETVDIPLPKAYSRENIPARRDQIPRAEMAMNWSHLSPIANEIPEYRDDMNIGLLIGNNCVHAIKPRDVISGKPRDPYAIKTVFGWGVIGATSSADHCGSNETSMNCHRVMTNDISTQNAGSTFVEQSRVKEVLNPNEIVKMFEQDFSERKKDKPISIEDRKFLDITEREIHVTDDGHYEIPLPFRNEKVDLPCNRKLAESRLNGLKSRFAKDPKYKNDYVKFIDDMLKKGYAEKAPQKDGKGWYLPHHGVYHPRKPNKIRVVFDCSSEYEGQSLNKHLLQGPDLTNTLNGVLCRFRKEGIAFTCDIEAMFCQVRVNEEHRDYLRFLWWSDGDTSKEPVDYRMRVHLFGATSSPGCSNLALKTTSKDGKDEFGAEAAEFLENSFYVDDGLKSVETVDQATKLITDSVGMCQKGGFRLHKFTANKREVIESVPVEYRATDIKEIEVWHDVLPIERVLGIEWCIESDCFRFRITLKDKPLTRRGVLATISSIYDPLGFVAPVLLTGKRILQILCKDNLDWDDPLPETLRSEWERWRADIHLLENMKVQRCFKPEEFGKVNTVELHHFSDASCEGYGQCSYLRLVDDSDRIHCSLVMGKSRVAPLKQVSIPRLELTAAVVSIKVSATLQDELHYEKITEIYWTDSKVVLGYVNNEARRFHVFVANRVQQIRDHSSKEQWNYVESKRNPADDASRGLKSSEIASDSRWINGPSFLYEAHQDWQHYNQPDDKAKLLPDDVEVKKVRTFASTVQEYPNMLERLEYFSSWYRAKKAIAICLRYRRVLLQRVRKRKKKNDLMNSEIAEEDIAPDQAVSVSELKAAELEIIKLVQKREFESELRALKPRTDERDGTRNVPRTSPIARLDPFMDDHGVIRVGGRIRRSTMDANVKHPVIMPKKSYVAKLIVRHFHEKIKHQGRGMTWNEIRASGYWILGCKDIVAKVIKDCTICQRLRASVKDQKMSDLPKERVETSAPFTYSAVDYFGPFYIKQGRKEIKRWGVLFTCLSSRAIHLEVSHTMETDSFLNAYRRFVSRRGPVQELRCDRGTNFCGASNELEKCLKEMDQNKIKAELLKESCDWLEFRFNVPKASHMGGIWERQIRTVRNVLNVLLYQNGSQLNDESLLTFMCEAESIVNSRPLSVDNLGLSDSLEPLTPNHLLTMKSKVLLPPPGVFQREDMYLRKRWRRVQHLCNEFWVRWKKEYVHSLQERQRWLKPRQNLEVGDTVIVTEEDTPRNCWPLARVITAAKDEDGLVRKVKVTVGDRQITDQGQRKRPLTTLERPVHKLILLMREEERPGVPAEEP